MGYIRRLAPVCGRLLSFSILPEASYFTHINVLLIGCLNILELEKGEDHAFWVFLLRSSEALLPCEASASHIPAGECARDYHEEARASGGKEPGATQEAGTISRKV